MVEFEIENAEASNFGRAVLEARLLGLAYTVILEAENTCLVSLTLTSYVSHTSFNHKSKSLILSVSFTRSFFMHNVIDCRCYISTFTAIDHRYIIIGRYVA
jgi:hypothetical protein